MSCMHNEVWGCAEIFPKLISGNSLVVIYDSATEVTSNMRTRKELLFAEETIVTRDR